MVKRMVESGSIGSDKEKLLKLFFFESEIKDNMFVYSDCMSDRSIDLLRIDIEEDDVD